MNVIQLKLESAEEWKQRKPQSFRSYDVINLFIFNYFSIGNCGLKNMNVTWIVVICFHFSIFEPLGTVQPTLQIDFQLVINHF